MTETRPARARNSGARTAARAGVPGGSSRRQQSQFMQSARRLVVAVLAVSLIVAVAEAVSGTLVGGWPAIPGAAVLTLAGALLARTVRAGQAEQTAEAQRLADLEQAGRHRSLLALDAMSGPDFEVFIAGLCHRDGFRVVKAGGGAGDLGADVIAEAPDGRRVVIQCKRYKADAPVPGPDMQRFLGTVRAVHKADVPVFVTTAWRFTKQCKELAASQGVVLIDRDKLSHWNNGVSLEKYFPAAPVS